MSTPANEPNTCHAPRLPRPRVLNGGKLVLSGGNGVIDCVVRDMSETGAKVRLTNATVLPDNLELLISKNHMVYAAQVRWNRNGDVGLRFTTPGKASARRY